MKKTVRTLSFIAAFALMATIIPLLRGGGLTAYASGSFDVQNGVLVKYTGDDATVKFRPPSIPLGRRRLKAPSA